ncbi:MAG: tetratricopeptide repeat protein [Desulfuromonadaceae bacterium]|nr:tetratricopeptide repeat protein [Desulfuromonadaceae bacterium]
MSPDQLLQEALQKHESGDVETAAELYRMLLTEYPFVSAASFNLGNIQMEQGLYEEAEKSYRNALEYEPGIVRAKLNLAFVVQEQGRYDEAIALNEELIKDNDELPEAAFNLATLRLLTGDFESGWKGYEQRFNTLNPVPRMHDDIPDWDGESRQGLHLLVCLEQGYGDAIQMSRYIQILANSELAVTVEAPKSLHTLFSSIPGVKECVARGTDLPRVDTKIHIMSLPGILKTSLETIPTVSPFISQDRLVQFFRTLLANNGGLKVGICLSGRLELPVNRKRRCPESFINTLLATGGVTFISLQKDLPITDERAVDLTGYLTDFSDTAALIENLDLVITIDTAIAHIAATIGKPTWLMLPFVPDWRWLLKRDDSPWYPTMRIFRQQVRGEWEPLIVRVKQELDIMIFNTAVTLINQGVAFDEQGNFEKALSCYRSAIAYDKDSALLYYNMGNSLKNMGESKKAEEAYEKALSINSQIAEAWHNLAILYQERGKRENAYRCIANALAIRPNFADALHTLGELYQADERLPEAIDSFLKAVRSEPGSARSWNSLGIAYQNAEEDRKAEECYRNALKHENTHLHARNNLGAALLTLRKAHESIYVLEQLVEMAPDYYDGHWNLACSLLAVGNFEHGWAQFEYRLLKHSPVEEEHCDIPRWDGVAPLSGKTILLTGEQAFGDTIQFVRFAPCLAALGTHVILECQAPPLVPLMAGAVGVDRVICRGETLPHVDFRLPLLSLPYKLGITPVRIAENYPYIHPDQEKLGFWKQLVSLDPGLRVGICWWGRQTTRNRRRSCSPDLLVPLSEVSGITLYRLQVGGEAPSPPFELIDHTEKIKDFADTAALISCLDLVITIDTAVAHLAGALGKPVWLMLPPTGDWRWLLEEKDSPWYPSMQIFRQSNEFGWRTVIDRIAKKLRHVTTPSVYMYRPGYDFPELDHLGKRLIPFLTDNDTLAEGINAKTVTDPEDADLFLFPYYLENLTEWVTIEGMWQLVEMLQMFKSKENQHIFFSDHDTAARYHTTSWWYRTSINILDRDPGALPLCYRTDDLFDYLHFDTDRIRYHASFVGFLGTRKQRAHILENIAKESRLTVMIEATDAFYGHLTADEKIARRQRFLEISAQSLCILCPSGEGTNSIRFYEALSLGRLPVLLSDCPLPFEDAIPYQRFVCRIAPEHAENAGEMLLNWLSGMGSDNPVDRCKEARKIWEEWFAPPVLPDRLWNDFIRTRFKREARENVTEPINTPHDTEPHSPRSPIIYLQQGRISAAGNNVSEAEKAFLKAIRYDHRCFEAYFELGCLLASAGRYHEASERFYEASLLQPDNPDIYRRALTCLEQLGRLNEAEFCRTELSRIAELHQPRILVSGTIAPETHMDLGDIFREEERWEEAFASYSQVIAIEPRNRLAQLRAGGALIFLNRHNEAESYLRQAVALFPDDPDSHVNLAFCHLAVGRWQDGWREFEWRRKYIAETLPDIAELPILSDQSEVRGKTVLVHTEQGYGDMLQFVRYLHLLKECGPEIVLSAPQNLCRLFSSSRCAIRVVPHGEKLPATDFQTLLMSLPLVLGKLLTAPFVTDSYVTADKELVEIWHTRLAELEGIKVGLAWKGRDLGKSGYRRSLNFEQLAPLLEVPGCSFVSLHPEALGPEISGVTDMSHCISDFADTAAIIKNVDLVITVDSAVAHLAGALGCPCLVALLYSPDWRWFPLNANSSLWYPSIRIYRQPAPGEWPPVVESLACSLREEMLTRKGNALLEHGNEIEALACYQEAVSHNGATAAAWLNLGVLLHRSGRFTEGRDAMLNSVRIDPAYPEAWQNLGLLQQALGDVTDAWHSFRRALVLRPDYPTAKWNLSLLQLLLGDYREGFRNFEFRFLKSPPTPVRHQSIKRWEGEYVEGKTILVHAEQGYGDTIQFVRFLPLLVSRGAVIILELQDQSLTELLRSIDAPITVITRNDETPYADFQIPLMSLPRIFDITLETVQACKPYLCPPSDKVKVWGNHLAKESGLKVGLAWKGRDEHINDRFRSCPLEVLLPLAKLKGVRYYSLQAGVGREQIEPLRQQFEIDDFSDLICSFDDTAALMVNLDLIITVDTAMAHLAGALGLQTWLMLPYSPDWRWGLNSATTAWYPTITLFRQDSPDDWHGVVSRVVNELSCQLYKIISK